MTRPCPWQPGHLSNQQERHVHPQGQPDRPRSASAARIDPRGPQFAAALTSVVLAGVLLLAPHPVGVALLAAQVAVFAVGAGWGVQRTPYAWLFKTLVRPRLGAPDELEDAAPPRFAQGVGLAFGLVALVGFLAGADLVGLVATGFALTAALLNAVFRFCLGCELYLILARWSSFVETTHLTHRTTSQPQTARPPGPATTVPTQSNKEHSMSRENSLVTAQWVEDHLDDPQVVVIEVDEDTTSYDKGHIRGAIKLDWTTDLQDQVRRDFVSKSQFEELLSERGVSNDHTVVLYGGNNNWFAAYAYWYFKLYGHQDVKLMDGGRKKWELDSRELTAEAPSREKTSYTAQEQDQSIRAFRDETVAAIGVKNLVDVRSPDEYAGRLLAPAHLPQEQAQRAGHVPTSINVPWSKNANDDGTFKSEEDLRALYADAGIDDSKETIALCRIGERSSLTWFVLKELLGHENVKNYDGSWTEYGSLVGVPIALGDEPGEA